MNAAESPLKGRMLLAAVLASSAASLSGCGVNLFGPAASKGFPELHGTPIADAQTVAFGWSPSGDEITFVSTDFRILYAYDVRSGTTRQLWVSTTTGEQVREAALSADGVDWFTNSLPDQRVSTDSFPIIRRHTASGFTILTRHGVGNGYGPQAGGRGILASPSQPLLAFIVQPDSLFLLRRGSAPSFIGNGCLRLVVYSPDESQVLCNTRFLAGSSGPFRTFRLDGSGSESLSIPNDVAASSVFIRWGTQGIQIVYGYGVTGLKLYDASKGSSSPFAPPVTFPESAQGHLSWSRDGTRAAYLTFLCVGPHLNSCDGGQDLLYVLDVASGMTARIGVHSVAAYGVSDSATQVAISSNGSMVAYTVWGKLYLNARN